MKTYKTVKSEIAKLEKQAEALRKSELKSVIAQVRKTIVDYDLTVEDIGFGKKAAKAKNRKSANGRKSRAAKTVGAPKYRDPKTQQTWTGHGRPPTWIVGAKNRDDYLIAGAAKPAAKPKAPKRPAKPHAAAKKMAKRGKTTKAAAPKKKTRAASKPAKKMIKTPAVRIESGVASE